MTDRIALVLGLVIAAATGLDLVANSGQALLFMVRKLADLVEYLAIWR